MTSTHVSTVPAPDDSELRYAFLFAEDRLGHYPEFRAFFTRVFDLVAVGLSRPGHVVAPSGTIYRLVFIGRSGEVFPSGLELGALVPSLEPVEESVLQDDVFAILKWMVDGVGGEWTVGDLAQTGKLFQIPGAG